MATSTAIITAHGGFSSAGAHSHAIAPMPVNPVKERRVPPMVRAIRSLAGNPNQTIGFAYGDLNKTIEVLGKMNPMYGGKPRSWVMVLLECANKSMHFSSQYMMLNAGLVYIMPHVMHRVKRRARLSLLGLQLVDHWADKNKNFKLFVDAFISKKARREIHNDCMSLSLGVEPSSYDKLRAQHEKEEKKVQAKQAAALAAAMNNSGYSNNTSIFGSNISYQPWTSSITSNSSSSASGMNSLLLQKLHQNSLSSHNHSLYGNSLAVKSGV